MDEHRLVVGMDLGNDMTRICYAEEEKISSKMAAEDVSLNVPSLLWRTGSDGSWKAGSEAAQASLNEEGERIESFINGSLTDTVFQTGEESFSRADLLEIYVRLVLEQLDGQPVYVTVTRPEMKMETVETLRQIGENLGFRSGHFAVLSHERSFAVQVLMQPRDIWIHGAGLFEYGDEGLIYREMQTGWNSKPMMVQVSDPVDCGRFDQEDPNERDQAFAEVIEKIAAPGKISSFFLFGSRFEEAVHGNEMRLSLQRLGAGRRRVFIGDNLYARGAFCSSLFLKEPDRRPEILIRDRDMTQREVCVRTLHHGTYKQTVLVPAGIAWYEEISRHEIIIGEKPELILTVRDPESGRQHQEILHLEGLPERPERTTRLAVYIRCNAPGSCTVTAADEGFGELFAATDKTWSMEIDMNREPEETEPPDSDVAIECMKIAEDAAFTMPVSGIRLHSPEELCWYIYNNTFAVTPDILDDEFFSWLDRVTGSREMTKAIITYQQGDKPFTDIIKLILRSVDYLTAGETAAVMEKMAQAEKSNKAELAKLVADNYCRSGLYMAALRCYQNLICKMNGEYDPLASRKLKAAVWHNAGIVFLKLHNTKSAKECMSAAFNLDPANSMLEDYLRVLYLDGDHVMLDEMAVQAGVRDEQMEKILEPVSGNLDEYWTSQRGKALTAGLKLRENSDEEYRAFCQAYLDKQKARYTIN